MERNAKFAWDRSVAAHGLDATIATCAYYTRKSRGLAHHLNMATWLEDGDVAFYATEQRKQPAVADVEAFRAAYARYPRPALDEEEALDLYHARIKPEERLAFLAAVNEYDADRAGKEKKFIKKWSTFVAGEWRECDAEAVLWRAILRAAGVEDRDELWYCTPLERDEDDRLTSNNVYYVWRVTLPEQVAELIEFVNANRARGYIGAIDGPNYYPDPITKTAAEIIDDAYQLLAAPPAPPREDDASPPIE